MTIFLLILLAFGFGVFAGYTIGIVHSMKEKP